MNILVIKQTSLGDVLHSTPHLRAIKIKYPDAHLTVLTATASAQIIENSTYVDEVILFDYVHFKQLGFSPRALLLFFRQIQQKVNQRHYDLAFDLQGLLRSVLFLYFTRANKKFVKGRWLGLSKFKNKQLHAVDEMTQVLALADIPVTNTIMSFALQSNKTNALQNTLASSNLTQLIPNKNQAPFIIISPFTRWPSKNWPLDRFITLANKLSQRYIVLITGASNDAATVSNILNKQANNNENIHDLTGALSLSELAQLMTHTALVISGDSFPMHLASSVGVPLITLFGPTDETKTGPRSEMAQVVRPDDCDRCDKPNCPRACLAQIEVERIFRLAQEALNTD